MKIEGRIQALIAVAILVMIGTAVVPFEMSRRAAALHQALLASEARNLAIQETLSLMKDAETGQRGFIITGREDFLEPYERAVRRLENQRGERLLALHGHSKEQVGQFEGLLARKLSDLARSIEIRRQAGAPAAVSYVATGRGKDYMDDIRAEVEKVRLAELGAREALRTEAARSGRIATAATLAATALDVGLVAVSLFFLLRLLKQQRRSADDLRKMSVTLQASVAELGQRNHDMATMAQMARALEASVSLDEALKSLAIFSASLLPATSGQLYLYRNSRNLLEKAAQWGTPRQPQDAFEPHECWGLRLGRPHHAPSQEHLCCSHYGSASIAAGSQLCLPLSAQGEMIGILTLEPGTDRGAPRAVLGADQIELATTLGEQLALALSNVKLKEALKRQSIIDPLTGLFNRRYMDETLQRELSRAKRKDCALSIVMLDIDHFKSVNDRYGHEAGDSVLRAVADRLKKNVRESDLVCRYGGEEILILMPECAQSDACARAERLRDAIRATEFRHAGSAIDRVTASFGVASYPDDALEPDSLVEFADQAMYQAKAAGRDRVVRAGAAPAPGSRPADSPTAIMVI